MCVRERRQLEGNIRLNVKDIDSGKGNLIQMLKILIAIRGI